MKLRVVWVDLYSSVLCMFVTLCVPDMNIHRFMPLSRFIDMKNNFHLSLSLFFDDQVDCLFHFFGLLFCAVFWMLQTVF